MKKHTLLIVLTMLLLLSIGLNCYFLWCGKPDLAVEISKPLSYDDNGGIASAYSVILDDRAQTEIILLAFVNALPTEDIPTSLPDGVVTVRYQATGYPYRIWFGESDIIIATVSGTYRRISNDHNNPVPLIKELIQSASNSLPG